MCISWQWPAWALWITILPFLILTDLWFGSLGTTVGLAVYLLPSALWIAVAATAASIETKHTYPDAITPSSVLGRLRRVVPYLVISTGMLPHQLSAFAEGLFGPMHSEFERTPKAASVTASSTPGESADRIRMASPDGRPVTSKAQKVNVHWPYVLTEAGFVAYQAAWVVLFATNGLFWAALGAAYLGACVLSLVVQYGDHAGRLFFVFDRRRLPFVAHGRGA